MPSANACAAPLGGADKSPQLSLTNLPSNTSKLAIVMDDEVSPCGTGENACVHWAVFNLPSTKTTITEGENLSLIAGVTYGETYDGASIGYAGACPPSNHVYKLTVYALNASTPNIPQNAVLTRSTFASTYGANILGQATWTGKYPN
jgi:Raf kinase inhibitor-like YbhB/YbcL family protein